MNNSDQGSGTEQFDHNGDFNNENNLDLSLTLSPIRSSRGEGMNSTVSANTGMILPSKRRYSDIDGGEFSPGESSRRRDTPQLGTADQQLAANYSSQANSSNYLTHYQLANVHRSSEVDAAIGQGLVPYLPNQSHAPRARYIRAPRSGTRAPRGGHVYLSRPIPVLASMFFLGNPEPRARIMINQVRATLEHLDATGMQSMGPSNERNTTIEFFLLPSKPEAKSGITEEEILSHIKRENFRLIGEESSENEEKCVVCQEEYVNGEEVGRLDFCDHRFHVNCIKQWLLIENLCPICKQNALAIDVDEGDHE